jgi:PAS domain S-box-containing protein
VAQAGAAPVLHYPGHPMVKSGPRQRPSGVHARPPKDLAEELRWRSDELETVNEELTSINDELSAAERAAQGAARRAQRSDRLLRQTLDTAARPFILCNPDNRIVLWNRAAARRYGLSAVQAVGKELFALLPGLDHRALRKACLKARTAEGARPESVTQGGERYLVDPFPGLASGRRHYLLRVGST